MVEAAFGTAHIFFDNDDGGAEDDVGCRVDEREDGSVVALEFGDRAG
jgi:hypothetical protein